MKSSNNIKSTHNVSPESREPRPIGVEPTGFFTEQDESSGQFDFNADAYAKQQIKMANYLEDFTGVTFWGTKPKFAEYDYHLCVDNSPHKFCGNATIVPGVPMYWTTVDGIAELKYRTVRSTQYETTILDADKLAAMKSRLRDMGTPAYIIWKFIDCYMYYTVNLEDAFPVYLGRNTYTSQDLPQEHKPQHKIPMSKLKPISKDMFSNIGEK